MLFPINKRCSTRSCIQGKIRILFSIEPIEEIKATIQKPRLQKYFTGNVLDEMLSVLDPYIDLITVSLCRDIKDNFLLALAKDGKADYLITGDKNLLIIENYGNTKIITITNFFTMEI